jgi:VanZ family protein
MDDKVRRSTLASSGVLTMGRLCLLLLLCAIVYLSFAPNEPAIVGSFNGVDKFKHGVAYFVLGITAALVVPRRHLVLVLCGCWLLSGIVELLQHLQPGRQASFYDWFANLAGLTLAYLIMKAKTLAATPR